MPELPEVETVARTLAASVVNRVITNVNLLNPGTWAGNLLPESLLGRTIISTGRRGKLLLLNLNPPTDATKPYALIFHLKMTGRVFAYPQGQISQDTHIRFKFDLDDQTQVVFDDTRKFGYVRAINDAELATWNFWQKLGPEPLDMKVENFIPLFKRSGKIKGLLLDQSVIAGIGNIYADESLFRANIHPAELGKNISPDRLHKLHHHLLEILNESIAACGSSIKDYRTANGDVGAFQNTFLAYGRKGQACKVCGTIMQGCIVAARGTVFCPTCQKENREE